MLDKLPEELLTVIIDYLATDFDVKSISALSKSCKRMYDLNYGVNNIFNGLVQKLIYNYLGIMKSARKQALYRSIVRAFVSNYLPCRLYYKDFIIGHTTMYLKSVRKPTLCNKCYNDGVNLSHTLACVTSRADQLTSTKTLNIALPSGHITDLSWISYVCKELNYLILSLGNGAKVTNNIPLRKRGKLQCITIRSTDSIAECGKIFASLPPSKTLKINCDDYIPRDLLNKLLNHKDLNVSMIKVESPLRPNTAS